MIDKEKLIKFIKSSLNEDIGNGDHSSLAIINNKYKNKAKLIIKDDGIIAGIELAKNIFKIVDPSLIVKQLLKDGDNVVNGDIGFIVEGKAISILSSERLVLNCLQHMSSIATKTSHLNSLISHTNAKLLDTRKTTPLNRDIEKWAVRIGGGINHRFGLYDAIMLKDNHIDFGGGVMNTIKKTKKYLVNNNINLPIIVEARDISEVREIIKIGGINRILLDNFTESETLEAVKLINNQFQIESSGNINELNIVKYAEAGVDFISVGALTHTLKNFDMSLKSF